MGGWDWAGCRALGGMAAPVVADSRSQWITDGQETPSPPSLPGVSYKRALWAPGYHNRPIPPGCFVCVLLALQRASC